MIQIFLAGKKFRLPNLSYKKEIIAPMVQHFHYKFPDELVINMFYGIHAVSITIKGISKPLSPFNHFFYYFWIFIVNIGKHQVIIIAELIINMFTPILLISNNFKNSRFFCL